jgi:hypothetical protein
VVEFGFGKEVGADAGEDADAELGLRFAPLADAPGSGILAYLS